MSVVIVALYFIARVSERSTRREYSSVRFASRSFFFERKELCHSCRWWWGAEEHAKTFCVEIRTTFNGRKTASVVNTRKKCFTEETEW